ncbi:MAG: glycosyltransferase [Planctomycetota bacterium]|nr:MAG: glycosyltransferase [Planctomycetota bacterium]
MKHPPFVTLLIVHFHTPKQTLLCLRLLKLNTSISHEIIVIDNSPQEPFGHYLARIPWITYCPNPQAPSSHRSALDMGVTLARGKWIAPLHSDTFVLKKGWLKEILLPRQNYAMIGSWERLVWPVQGIWDKIHCWIKRRRILRFWAKTGKTPRWISYFGLFPKDLLEKYQLTFAQKSDDIRDDCGLAIQRFLEANNMPICWLSREYLSQYLVHFEGASLNAVTKRSLPRKRKKRIQTFYSSPEIQKILSCHKIDEVPGIPNLEELFSFL